MCSSFLLVNFIWVIVFKEIVLVCLKLKEIQMKAKKLRIEDAPSVTKAAAEEGVVAGVKAELLSAISAVDELLKLT